MKSLRLIFVSFVFFVVPSAVFTGCATAPSARVVQVQTLKAVGQSAETAVATAAHLYAAGTITAAQLRTVAEFYDQKFQPVYRLAAAAVAANLDSLASPELAGLAAQLSALVLGFTAK
ncbi:MAG: hypothetical protein RLZZ15_591 [Verrucomicrobiota bacterium]|jgi:hypothetical protein